MVSAEVAVHLAFQCFVGFDLVLQFSGKHFAMCRPFGGKLISFFFFFFGRERYSLHEATITTSKKRDVHCIPLQHMYGGVISMLMADRRRLTIWHGD